MFSKYSLLQGKNQQNIIKLGLRSRYHHGIVSAYSVVINDSDVSFSITNRRIINEYEKRSKRNIEQNGG